MAVRRSGWSECCGCIVCNSGSACQGAEDAVTDSLAVQAFVGIDLERETAPDATTLLQFRHLLEKHGLTKTLFETINRTL